MKHGGTERKDEGGRMRDEIGKCISSSFISSVPLLVKVFLFLPKQDIVLFNKKVAPCFIFV